MTDYIFNIICHTTGSNVKSEYEFDIPPFYFNENEYVDGNAKAVICTNEMRCILTDNYICEAVSNGYSSSYMYTTKSIFYSIPATGKIDSRGSVVATKIVSITATAKIDSRGSVIATLI